MTAGPRNSEAEEVELGSVSGVFGVRGEVRLFLHNPATELFEAPREVVLQSPDGRRRPARLSARRGAGKRILGRIDGVDDRDAAAALKDWRVLVPRDALPDPEPGEFYVAELEGVTVRVGDREVGTLATIHATAGGDVLEVHAQGEVRFVPLVARWVLEVQPGSHVTLAEGALEEG